MCHPRVVLTIAGLLSAFGLSGCLPQFGCGRDEHVELRDLIYRCVDDISYDDSYDYVVGTAPTTSIAVSRNPAEAGQQVSIYAIDEDIDGDVVDHSWDLDGDGSFETDTDQGTRTSHSYPPGRYELKLRVTDGDGNVADASKTLDVEAGGGGVSPGGNSDPTASFTVTPSPGRAGESVHFDGSGSEDSDGSVVSYQWDFENDGQFDTQPDASPIATHVYPTPGQKTVKLRVADDEGATGETTRDVLIAEQGPGRIVAAGRRSKPVRFSAQLKGRPLKKGLGKVRRRGRVSSRNGLIAAGRFSGRALGADPALLGRFGAASWLARLDFTSNRHTHRAGVKGIVLVTFDGDTAAQACVRIGLSARRGRKPRGSFRIIGANGEAAGLTGQGTVGYRSIRGVSARLTGTLLIGTRKAPRIPKRCAALARTAARLTR